MRIQSPKLIADSTREWIAEARRTKNYRLMDFIHGYIYGRWPYFYISVGSGEHPLTRFVAPVASKLIEFFARFKKAESISSGKPTAGEMFANTYHGKVVTLEVAKQLVQVKEEISVSLPEKVIPYDRARDIIFKNPDHILLLDCPCRVAREHPCLPLDVCLIIGEPFVGFVHEHHPTRSRLISADEAVEVLKAEDERGHVHHAFFKEAMLNRFYAICNCCDCCCGAMQAQRSGVPMLASSGYVAQVDADLCAACGTCETVCQFHAVSLIPTQAHAQIDAVLCMGCGICVNHCSQDAITLQRDASRGEPLEMLQILQSQ